MTPPENTPAAKPSLRMGGMALHNGLLLQTAHHWAAAVREADGSVSVASGEKRSFGTKAEGVPLVRGVLRLADAMAVLPRVKSKLGSAVFPVQGARVAGTLAASAVGTLALRRRKRGNVLAQEIGAALLALAPAAVAFKDSPVARYHGAEHKSIGEFERLDRGESPAEATKEHERCGSNLIGPLLVTTVVGNTLVRSLARRPSPGVAAATSVVSLGAAMELFRWMTKHPDTLVARAMSRPGYLLQHFFTTEEPTSEQMEVAHAALAELLRVSGADAGPPDVALT